MDCRELQEVVFLYTDNEMGQDLLVSFRQHVERCPECERHVNYTRRLLTLLRERCCRQAAPPGLRLRILDVLPPRGPRTEWD